LQVILQRNTAWLSNRRRLLHVLTSTAGVPGVASAVLFASMAAQSPSDTLRTPPVVENQAREPGRVEIELTAGRARLPLIPGTETDVYAYNGRVPGPTLELREGDEVVIRFHNALPEATTVHWHGLHLPFAADGSPFHPVAPGETFEYRFTVRPGSAGTYWYHPHPHHRTAWQVGMGLYGAVIVRAREDPLPENLTEKLLILSDNRFRADGSLDFPDPDSPQGRIDEMNGREGDVLFVNDGVLPRVDIRSGEVQRWRVINASGARIYRLAIPGHTFLHVGSDGGLFERPVEIDEIVLSNGERAELLVRGSAAPGARTALQSLPYDRYMPRTRPADWGEPRDVLTLQYSPEPPGEPVVLPATLRAGAGAGAGGRYSDPAHAHEPGPDQREDHGHEARGCPGSTGRHGDLGRGEPGGDGPPVSSARLPVPGAGSKRRACAVSELEGHGERSEAGAGPVHCAIRESPREVDVPLPYPRP
jgi:FtsP/CotA-like multicopper oxidase with cupredoxin domain